MLARSVLQLVVSAHDLMLHHTTCPLNRGKVRAQRNAAGGPSLPMSRRIALPRQRLSSNQAYVEYHVIRGEKGPVQDDWALGASLRISLIVNTRFAPS